MPFEFEVTEKVWWPIHIKKAVTGGQSKKVKAELLIMPMTVDEWEAMQKMDGAESNDALAAHVSDWKVNDEHGKPLEFTPELFLAALKNEAFITAAVIGMRQVCLGEASAKN